MVSVGGLPLHVLELFFLSPYCTVDEDRWCDSRNDGRCLRVDSVELMVFQLSVLALIHQNRILKLRRSQLKAVM